MNGLERRYKLCSLLSPFSMIGEVLMETVIPLLVAKIIDIGIADRNTSYVLKIGVLMLFMSCISLACGAAGARLAAVASQGFSCNVRRNLFSKVQSFSFGNVDHFSTSSLVTRLTTDVTNIQNTYQMIIRGCVRAPFMMISGTIMACRLNFQLASIFLVAIPFLVIVLTAIAVTAFPRFQKMLAQYDNLNNTVQENLIASRVVKSFVRRDYENDKFCSSADLLRRLQKSAECVVIWNAPVMQFVVYTCIISALWFGGRMIVFGSMQTGELISFITYISQILMALMMLSMMFIMIVLSRASIVRIIEVLSEEPEIVNPSAEAVTDVADGSVDFENVSFSYLKDKNNVVLNDISLHIDSGSVVGILGGTGSSKTTLISLISRLYDTLEGTVKVGGVDVTKYDLTALRDSVSVVLQKNVLFSGSIKENLRWGNENASDEEIKAACIAADADEFVSSFPNGYDTELGQGGVNLSGGQKQRLCIARALLKKPKILILDDSTSAVDTATDARIRTALRNSLPETTKIIIAQRLTSVQDADVIYVLDNGKIAASGKHDELLKTCSIYKEVYDSQQSNN